MSRESGVVGDVRPRIVEQFPFEPSVIVAGPFDDHAEAIRVFRAMKGYPNRHFGIVFPALPWGREE